MFEQLGSAKFLSSMGCLPAQERCDDVSNVFNGLCMVRLLKDDDAAS